MTRPETLRTLIEPTLQRMGYDLVAVELTTGPASGGHGRPIVRVSIDKRGGITAGDCARVTHRLGPIFDENDPFPGAWHLEVSSPGIERPVQRLADFERYAGYRCRIRLEEGLPRRRYTGTLRGVADGVVQIEVDGQLHGLAFESIQAANLVLDLEEFERIGQENGVGADLADVVVDPGEVDPDVEDGVEDDDDDDALA